MPSIRKRIGYLPSLNIQEIITSIAKKEKLSQSKVVGILVEEALIARSLPQHKKENNFIRKSNYENKNKINNPYFKYSDVDELISDKGITYNTKKDNCEYNDFFGEQKEAYDKYLFEQFKQFILFQNMIEKK